MKKKLYIRETTDQFFPVPRLFYVPGFSNVRYRFKNINVTTKVKVKTVANDTIFTFNLETQAKHKSHNWRSKSAKYQSHVSFFL